ncbi:MAG: GatB/YqeY domain-containing protein [Weeksellaceae bacterium]|nr:GatB/YqeY domain-containing protein [Weeksellaceae bacterium]
MSLESKITEQLKEAMKAKNSIALEALRAIKSEILLIKTSGKSTEISDAQETALLQKMIKQRKEAAEHFSANNRTELAEKEMAQIEVIQKFLPEQLSPDALEAELKKIIAITGAASAKDMGKVMGVAGKQLAGRAEGRAIADMVKKLLNQA